jgi:hypothetical protein
MLKMRKALVAVVSACSFHVRFLSKITPMYFTWFAKGMCLPFSIREASTGVRRWEKLNLNVPALTSRLHDGKTALDLSKDITLFANSGIQTRVIGKQGQAL